MLSWCLTLLQGRGIKLIKYVIFVDEKLNYYTCIVVNIIISSIGSLELFCVAKVKLIFFEESCQFISGYIGVVLFRFTYFIQFVGKQ